nr:hypothetical protein [Tanacetum cinerariifolium]
MMATMDKIVNLLSGFQKQFLQTNNQLRASSNPRSHATVHDGRITTEPVQRRAPGNVVTAAFNVDHENAYDSDVDEDPHAAVAFMGNLTSAEGTSGTSSEVINEVHTYDHNLDDNNAPGDNNDPYDNCQPYGTSFYDLVLMADVTPTLVDEVVPPVEETTVLSPQETPNESPSEFEALLGLQAELHGYVLANREQLLEISNLNVELAQTLALDYEKRAQLLENPRIVSPVDYKALNKLYDTFVSQKEPSHDQVYWKPPKEVTKPKTPYFHTRPKRSEVFPLINELKHMIGNLDPSIREHTQKRDHAINIDWWLHARMVVLDHFMPFIDMFRKRVYDFAEILKKEVKVFEHIFDDLAAKYDQEVKKVKCLEITNRNLVHKIDFLISDNIASEVSALVLTADNLPLETQDNPSCVREIAKCLELEAENGNLKKQLSGSEERCSQIEKHSVELELKFQKYRDCFEHPSVCDNTQSPEYNAFFEINKLKEQLQGKDNTIKQLQTQLVTAQAIQVGPNVGVKPASGARKPLLKRVPQPIKSLSAKQESRKRVEVHHRNLNKLNRVDSRLNFKPTGFVSDSIAVCKMARGKVETSVRQEWKPTGHILSLYDSYPLTRIAETEEMHLAQTPCVSTSDTVAVPSRFIDVVQIVLWYLDSGCLRHMIGDRSKLINYVDKFIGTVRFGNDKFATIVGYGDYKLGDTVITRVYYAEGTSRIHEWVLMLGSSFPSQQRSYGIQEDKMKKEKEVLEREILDAEAEAFLADVECDEPSDEPLAITTTTAFNVDHKNAYDSDVD